MSSRRSGRVRRTWCALALATAGLVLVGCGGGAAPGAPAPVSASPAATTPSPTASSRGTGPGEPLAALTVVVREGDRAVSRTELTCEPAGGDHVSPEAACRALADRGDEALPPVPKGRSCTEIYGGSQTATVTGRWRGEPVNSRFSRVNGCEISRWDALVGLLPKG